MKTIKVYTREGCKWCDAVKPIIEELKVENADITFEVIDDTTNFKAGKPSVETYPTSIGFNEKGEQKRTVTGAGDTELKTTKKHILSSLNDRTIDDYSALELAMLRTQVIEKAKSDLDIIDSKLARFKKR